MSSPPMANNNLSAGPSTYALLRKAPARSMDASSCHALWQRLPEGLNIPTLLDRIGQGLRRRGWSVPLIEIETLDVLSRSPEAERRRNRELTVQPSLALGHQLRGLVMIWADRKADLVLVARRTSGGMDDLISLLREANGRQPLVPAYDGSIDSCVDPGSIDTTRMPVAEWGLAGEPAGDRRLQLESNDFAPKSSFTCRVAALALVLARLEGRRQVVIAVFAHPAFSMLSRISGKNWVRLVEIDLDRSPTVLSLSDDTARQLAEGKLIALDAATDVALVGITGPAFHSLPDGATYRAHVQAPFALTVEIPPEGEIVGCRIDLDTRHFSTAMARTYVDVSASMARRLQEALTTSPDLAVAELEWIDASEGRKVVSLGHAEPLPEDAELSRVDERIARHALAHPDQVAITCDGQNLDYRMLNDLAGRIASVLVACGVREGSYVGVLIERRVELVPVLLGVLRAGAAYVPVDPTYPADRIAYTLEDAAPIVIIGRAPEGITTATNWITVETLLARARHAHPHMIQASVGVDVDAYVIYTSGSTGRPKGVVVPHRNVGALIDSTRKMLELGPSDTWTLFHSTAFDFSVWEIWACLSTGGRLLIVPYDVTRSPEDFRSLLCAEQVTVLNQTPSAFAQLVDVECRQEERSKLSLRLVIFGGEGLDCRMLLRWFDRYPESACRLVNMFGITETTVHVTAEPLTRAHALIHSRSVGRAIPGWGIYVLDEAGHLVPPLVSGEIYVAGEGVAKGYLNRTDLSAQRFLADPFLGGRMYRSGDRGRLRSDGRLEHLGRIDSQVKIRGFRIELDEIRAVLLETPGTTAAAVIVNHSDPNDAASARLDAYVVLTELGGDLDAVRRHVERTLPAHMVPATVTCLSSLPLTANGKLDVLRLPAPIRSASKQSEYTNPDSIQARAMPAVDVNTSTTPLESALQQIWSEVLGVPVSLDDNFFELGGNSLYAVRLAAAMKRKSLPPVPLRDLYVHQTVRNIARLLPQ